MFADLFVGAVNFLTDVTLTKTIVKVVVIFVSSDLSVLIEVFSTDVTVTETFVFPNLTIGTEVFSTDETGTKIIIRGWNICVS